LAQVVEAARQPSALMGWNAVNAILSQMAVSKVGSA